MKAIISTKNISFYLAFSFWVVTFLGLIFMHDTPNRRIFYYDVLGYYIYLPAVFEHQDLQYNFFLEENSNWKNDFTKENGYKLNDGFTTCTPTNKGAINCYTCGVAITFIPGYFVARAISGSESKGFGKAFRYSFVLNNLLLALATLTLLYIILLRFFNSVVSAISTSAIGLTTNFTFYASTCPGMGHIPGLLTMLFFILFLFKFFDTHKNVFLFLAFLFLGFSILIRPTNAIFGLFFLFLEINNFSEIFDRLKNVFFNPFRLILVLLGLIIFPFLQIIIWKISQDKWIIYSYGNYGFNFANPMYFKGLFSPQKGWILYSPMLILFPFGIFLTKNLSLIFRLGLSIVFIIFSWVIFSWVCWWYGGGYSMRALIESSIIVAVGYAGVTQSIITRPFWVKFFFSIVFLLAFGHNIIRLIQVQRNIIHTDATSWTNFKQIGLKTNISNEERKELEKNLEFPEINLKK